MREIMVRAGHLLSLMNSVLMLSNGSYTLNNEARPIVDKYMFSFSKLYDRRKQNYSVYREEGVYSKSVIPL
jgi:hypothetical protein